MSLRTQAARLAACTIVAAMVAGCASAPPLHETPQVAALRQRAQACAWFENMDVTDNADAVLRLRGVDSYRCEHMKKEAVHLMRDPASNPSGDQRTEQFLENLGYPQGRT